MSKSQNFFKSFDRYAQVVSLKYDSKGKFETVAGGLATIFFFIILAYWVAVNLFYSVYDNGSFATELSTKVTQMADGNYPVFEFNNHQLFIAYRLNSFSDHLEAEIDRYV